MISDEVKESIIRSGGIHTLLEMAVSGDEVELPDIATNATKTLVILGFLGNGTIFFISNLVAKGRGFKMANKLLSNFRPRIFHSYYLLTFDSL